jgi:hypothetical protein
MLYTVAAAGQLKILGVPAFTFIIIFMGLVLILFLLWWYRFKLKKRSKHQEATIDSIVIAIKKMSTAVEFHKCRIFKGEIRDFSPEGSRQKFHTDKFVNPNDDYSSPEKYWAVPGFGKLIWWPIGLEKHMPNGKIVPDPTQVQMMMWCFDENDQCPKWPNDPKRWNPGEAEQVTAAMAQEAFNEAGMQAVNKSMQGIVQNIEKFVALIQRIPTLFLITCGGVLISVITLFMVWQVMNKVAAFAGK